MKLSVRQRTDFTYEQLLADGNPLSVPSLGVAYPVLNKVQAVHASLEGKIAPGDVVTSVKLLPPQAEIDAGNAKNVTIDFKKQNWAAVAITSLQLINPGTRVELTIDGKTEPVTVEPVSASDWFNPDRALYFEGDSYVLTAGSLGEDIRWRPTRRSRRNAGLWLPQETGDPPDSGKRLWRSRDHCAAGWQSSRSRCPHAADALAMLHGRSGRVKLVADFQFSMAAHRLLGHGSRPSASRSANAS